MSNDSGKTSLNRKQLHFLMEITGESTPMKAVESLAMAMVKEKVDISLLEQYVIILMERFEIPK